MSVVAELGQPLHEAVFLNGIADFLPNARLEEVTGKLNEMQQE